MAGAIMTCEDLVCAHFFRPTCPSSSKCFHGPSPLMRRPTFVIPRIWTRSLQVSTSHDGRAQLGRSFGEPGKMLTTVSITFLATSAIPVMQRLHRPGLCQRCESLCSDLYTLALTDDQGILLVPILLDAAPLRFRPPPRPETTRRLSYTKAHRRGKESRFTILYTSTCYFTADSRGPVSARPISFPNNIRTNISGISLSISLHCGELPGDFQLELHTSVGGSVHALLS